MKIFRNLLVILFLISSLTYAEESWVVVEKVNFDWNQDKKIDQVILERPRVWNDPGDFTRIRIKIAGKKEFILKDESGLSQYKKNGEPSNIKSSIKSNYMALFPISKKFSESLLMMFGYEFGSSPGKLLIITLNQEGFPEIVFYKTFNIIEFKDINNDKYPEMIGQPWYAQGLGSNGDIHTYCPMYVYRFYKSKTNFKVVLDLRLSKKYNEDYGAGWAGPDPRSDIVEIIPLDGSNPRLMNKKEAFKVLYNLDIDEP